MKIQQYIFWFLIGAVVGPILDGIHTHSDTLAYPYPIFFKMAWWVPPLFGTAAVALVSFVGLADRALRRVERQISRIEVGLGFLFFVMIYMASGFWQAESLEKTSVFTIAGILFWFVSDRTWQGALEAFLVVIAGCAVESLLIQAGLFYYLAPDFLGIPYWLGPLYIVAVISVGNLSRSFFSSVYLFKTIKK
jgi:preprotein translocase subunit Sec61beta